MTFSLQFVLDIAPIIMTSPSFLITGTDTEIGKTWASLALMHYLKNQGLRVAGMKPVATGCRETTQGLRNEDAEQLLQLSGLNTDYVLVNPYHFLPPISPHIAAAQVNQRIDLDKIIKAHQELSTQADVVLVEGIGGWRVPLNDVQFIKDIAQALDSKIILVIGIRLGCINHGLLTVEAIARDGCDLIGWIANIIDPDFSAQTSIDTLKFRINAPLLGQLPFLARQNIAHLAKNIEGEPLMKYIKGK
jgi:dethiobiotin synthetase